MRILLRLYLRLGKAIISFGFYLLYHQNEMEQRDLKKFEKFEERYPYCKVDFVKMGYKRRILSALHIRNIS